MADARFANVVRRVIKPSQVFMLGRSNIVLREQHRSTLTDDADKRYSLYPGHQSTTLLERTVLTVGSGVVALLDQRRGDMVAVFGETTGLVALRRLKHKMMASTEGRLILRDRPRITSQSIGFERLKSYPEGSLGKTYVDFMISNKITPDARLPVKYVDDAQAAYVMQRYREIHDFTHVILNQEIKLNGEITVKWFEAVQTGLPMCSLGALGATLRLPLSEQSRFWSNIIPKTVEMALSSNLLMNVYFEKYLEEPIADFRSRLGIQLAVEDTDVESIPMNTNPEHNTKQSELT